MSSYIRKDLRQLVAQRANYCCEYCLLPDVNYYYRHEPDHILASQHGGKTSAENLAFTCFSCNRFKGPNLTSIDAETGIIIPLFNPRTQVWSEHFSLDGPTIHPLTAESRVTASLLRLNDHDRVEERRMLIVRGLYG